MRSALPVLFLIALSHFAFGQNQPAFDVASVKHVDPAARPSLEYRPPREYGRYTLRFAPLKVCLQIAFRLMPYRISGPAWMDSERYEIVATMPAETPDDQVSLMLQRLLIERFQIKFHWEERETAVYALTEGKGGARLLKTADPAATPRTTPGASSLDARNRSLDDLAGILMLWTDRPVVNLTGLAGSYDFKLAWSADGVSPAGNEDARQALSGNRNTDASGPLHSLDALGLKAESRKLPLKFLVIESAARTPTAN